MGDILISEYVEGSSNNKTLELYNSNAIALNTDDRNFWSVGERAIASNSILFIDSTVDDCGSLIGAADPEVKIVILDPYRDGIEQITETLTRKGNGGVVAVHIVSHGSRGCLYLGNCQLSGETVERYASQLRQWGQMLGENADILIYGCLVGADLAFVRRLGELTGANIAASATPTGNAALGGDWNLEVRVGDVSSGMAFAAGVREVYAGVFADVTVTTASDTVDGDTSSVGALLANFEAIVRLVCAKRSLLPTILRVTIQFILLMGKLTL